MSAQRQAFEAWRNLVNAAKTIEKLLSDGVPPAMVLDENSPTRDALRDGIRAFEEAQQAPVSAEAGELPPLPERVHPLWRGTHYIDVFSADQMRYYARAAIAQSRAQVVPASNPALETLMAVAMWAGVDADTEQSRTDYDGSGPASQTLIRAIERKCASQVVPAEPEAIRVAYKTGYDEGYADGSDGMVDHDACEEGWQQYRETISAPAVSEPASAKGGEA
jgi:hypothetical protein